MPTELSEPPVPAAKPPKWRRALVASIAGVAVGVGFRMAVHRDPPPLVDPVVAIGSSDGLPSTLRAGQDYTATFTITFPADWPGLGHAEDPSATALVGAVWDNGLDTGGGIVCSGVTTTATMPVATFSCPIRLDQAGKGILLLGVGGKYNLPADTVGVGIGLQKYNSRAFEHTVS